MRKTHGRHFLFLGLLVGLSSCSAAKEYSPYAYGPLNTEAFVEAKYENYVKLGDYSSLSSEDHAKIPANLASIYAYGNPRYVLPSAGEVNVHVIPVDFVDAPFSELPSTWNESIRRAFFGVEENNQYESVASYYDKASFHRLHVKGEVCDKAYRSPFSYGELAGKRTSEKTKQALTDIYNGAKTWYNALPGVTPLGQRDAVYFVYLAPYSSSEGSSRSSMMWAFTVNDPAPISWSSFYMMHPREDGTVDAHTYIHEFGHMLGLPDYYDPSSDSESPISSPLGRMDMMDCSLGEHNAFSKMALGWTRPYVPSGEATIRLRPYSGNGDCILLPLTDYNGTPFDEYLLLEYYTPSYLNRADAKLRSDPAMSLMKESGIRVYHVDGRLGLFQSRGGERSAILSPSVAIGGNSLDFAFDNSGIAVGRYVTAKKGGFLIQCLDASSSSGKLLERYVASDHTEDISSGGATLHLRDSLFREGRGVDSSFADLSFHTGQKLSFGFAVKEITTTYAEIQIKAN